MVGENTALKIFSIDCSVIRETISAITAAAICPASNVAVISENLATKPDSGGSPASDIAATPKASASRGSLPIRPLSSESLSVPKRCSIAPADRNSEAFTIMWCSR